MSAPASEWLTAIAASRSSVPSLSTLPSCSTKPQWPLVLYWQMHTSEISSILPKLDLSRRSGARGHPKLIMALIDFAEELCNRGRREEGHALLEEALGYGVKRLGPTHQLVVKARSRLVASLKQQGDHQQAARVEAEAAAQSAPASASP